MKKHTQLKFKLLVLGLLTVLAAGLAGVGFVSANRVQEPTPERRREVAEAARSGGFREMARLKGDYVVSQPVNSFVKFDLDSITKRSAAVVVATAEDNLCRLSPDGKVITTDYRMRVQEVLKGKVREGDTVEVSLPGGRVVFEDGTSAQVNTPDFRKMENGKTYVLYLIERGPGFDSYTVAGGPQGLFEAIDGGASVRPHGNYHDPLARKYKDKGEAKSFLKQARRAAKNWPDPASCCK